LIYFIFRYDTYVISFVFTCLMIIGGFAAEVRILLERTIKTPYFRRSGKFQKNTRKFYFTKRLWKPEGGGERSQGQPHAQGARPDPWPRRPCVRPP
jgi:hypothetical protein